MRSQTSLDSIGVSVMTACFRVGRDPQSGVAAVDRGDSGGLLLAVLVRPDRHGPPGGPPTREQLHQHVARGGVEPWIRLELDRCGLEIAAASLASATSSVAARNSRGSSRATAGAGRARRCGLSATGSAWARSACTRSLRRSPARPTHRPRRPRLRTSRVARRCRSARRRSGAPGTGRRAGGWRGSPSMTRLATMPASSRAASPWTCVLRRRAARRRGR